MYLVQLFENYLEFDRFLDTKIIQNKNRNKKKE